MQSLLLQHIEMQSSVSKRSALILKPYLATGTSRKCNHTMTQFFKRSELDPELKAPAICTWDEVLSFGHSDCMIGITPSSDESIMI